jgi:hypothetical protein
MNFAVLIVDYDTNEFEGANVAHYPLCEQCDSDALPIELDTRLSGGLEFWALVYTETRDTLLYATVVHNGDGHLVYPSEIVPADQFNRLRDSVPLPDDFELIGGCHGAPELQCRAEIQQAWGAVSDLDVVHAYAKYPHRVGVVFYPRMSARFDPSYSDWIFLLYRGKVWPS